MLVPAINATVWEQGVSNRVLLFRDWIWRDHKPLNTFFAGVQKVGGKATQNSLVGAEVVAFGVLDDVSTILYSSLWGNM